MVKIVVVVEEGQVQSVFSTDKDTEVEIFDFDTLYEGEEEPIPDTCLVDMFEVY